MNYRGIDLLTVVSDNTFNISDSAESALEKGDLFLLFLDHLPGAAWIKTASGRLVYVNGPLKESLVPEAYRQDWFGRTDLELWPDFAEEYRANDDWVRREKKTLQTIETSVKDGLHRKSLVTKFLLPDDLLGGIAIDMTGHLEAKAALRDAEQKYRDMFDNAAEGIFQTTPDGKFITANPALARMFGFDSAEDLIRERTNIARQHYVNPNDREEFKRLLEANGSVRDFEYRARRKDGSEIWISDSVRAVRDADMTVQYYEGLCTDITERKRSQEALKVSEQKYKNIFSFAPVGIYQARRDGTIITANQTLADMLRYDSAEDLMKLNLALDVYLVPAQRGQIIAQFEEQDFADAEVQWKQKDGSAIWVQLEAHFVKRIDGETDYFEGFVRDITEQWNAREALRVSEERYRELFENSKDAIYVHDLTGRYLSLNRAAERLSGYSRDEVIGKHYSNFVAPADIRHARTNLCRKLDDEGETTYEIELVTRDRRRVPVEVNSRLIFENGRPVGVQGIARDISERRRAQEALRNYSRRLIEAQEAERQSLARELHDEIGQILTAVKINLQTVARSCGTSETMPYFDESLLIIDDALSRVRELSLELRPAVLDNLGLAAALRWYITRYSQRTGIAVEFINGIGEHGRLARSLETECFRITQEALTNVIRHAKADRVTVQLKQSAQELELTIADNGVGFKPGVTSDAPSAASLGLRGMRERALAMNGGIDIKSTLGHGTRVRAIFPLSETK